MNIKFPPLELYQKDVLRYLRDNPKNKTIVIKSPRQVGKSILIEIILLWCSLRKENSYSVAISPINQQSRKLYKDITRIGHRLINNANASLLEIEFINGSVIKFGSCEQGDNLRGLTIKGEGVVVVDECAYIKEDFYNNVVIPFTNVSHNDIIVCSTPRSKSGLFYGLYKRGMEEDPWVKSFDWTLYDLSRFLTPDLLERYREELPRTCFMSEYMGEFIDGESAVFGEIEKCIREGEEGEEINKEIVIGIDWGTGVGGDSTVLTPGWVLDHGIYIKESVAFNNKTTNQTIEFILRYVQDMVERGVRNINLVVEQNSIGQVYYSLLFEKITEWEDEYNLRVGWRDEIDIQVNQFLTTNSSKKRIVERTVNLFEKNKISIPNDSSLVSELSEFEYKISPSGTITYNGRSGCHDDRVMSMCFVVDTLYNEI